MLPKPRRSVGARHDQFALAVPASLLKGHVGFKALDVRFVRHAVKKREGRVPGFRDDPVRSHLVRQVMAECHQGIGALRAIHPVDRAADALFVHVEGGAREFPVLAGHAARQDPHEAQSALVHGAEARQPHDSGRIAKRCLSAAHGHIDPKFLAKNLYQFPPMMALISEPFMPTDRNPFSIFAKSRLSWNQSGIGGNPGAAADPSP